MEKLVLTFSSGDGHTYSCGNDLPFLAESKIAAELELLEIWQDWQNRISDSNGQFVTCYIKFHGYELDFWNFTHYDDESKECSYSEPEILTLYEWFDKYCEDKLVDAAQN